MQNLYRSYSKISLSFFTLLHRTNYRLIDVLSSTNNQKYEQTINQTLMKVFRYFNMQKLGIYKKSTRN